MKFDLYFPTFTKMYLSQIKICLKGKKKLSESNVENYLQDLDRTNNFLKQNKG